MSPLHDMRYKREIELLRDLQPGNLIHISADQYQVVIELLPYLNHRPAQYKLSPTASGYHLEKLA